MSIILLGENLIEASTATVTVTSAASGKPITRVYDRDRSLQWEGGSAAQMDIDVDLGASPTAADAFALVNHNITGVTVTLYGDNSSPPTTSRATSAPASADVLVTFTTQTLRYWRVRIPVMASAARLGELLLGTRRTISQNPTLPSGRAHTVGNVRRYLSPGGYPWAVQRGDKRAALRMDWRGLSETDLTALENAFDDCDQGAKHLVVQDSGGTVRWMRWLNERLDPEASGRSTDLVDVSSDFEAAL